MRTGTVSYKLEDLKKGAIIPIGFVGENDFTRVFFDAEEIYKKYPSASVSMKIQPPKGGIYPAIVTRDGNTVIWQVKEADVANRGGGELQLTFIDGETKIKTYIAKTDVKRSLAGNGPAPDPIQDFVDNANEKLAEVDDALEDLAAMDNIAKNAEAGDIGKALSPKTVENGVVTEWEYITPGGGTEDYTDLENKPSIAGVTLSGNKTLHDLGIAAESAIPDVSGKANLSVVAPAFDQATANDAGSLVMYTDGVVYVLPEGHTAGTTWANTQKTATNIAEQQRLLKNAIQGKYTKPSGGIPASDIADGVIPVVDSALSDSSENAVQNKVVKGALDTKAPMIVNIATGNPAVFNDGGGMSIKSLLIPFTPKQSGTGDPSPENIRPILPWSGLTVWQMGRNLLNPVWWDNVSENKSYVRYEDGTLVYQAITYKASDYVSVMGNTEYTLHAIMGGQSAGGIAFFDSSKQYISGIQVNNNAKTDHTFTTPSNASYMRFWDNGGIMPWNEVMLVYGSTAPTAYEPYKPITETEIPFASPVYGGTLDVVSGVLTVGYVGWVGKWSEMGDEADLGDVTRKRIIIDETFANIGSSSGKFCNIAKYKSSYGDNSVHFYVGNGGRMYLFLPNGTDGDTEVQIVSILETPKEIQLTPEQLTALVGDNTIWSDANGQMIVEYPADTKTYINNLIAIAIASL